MDYTESSQYDHTTSSAKTDDVYYKDSTWITVNIVLGVIIIVPNMVTLLLIRKFNSLKEKYAMLFGNMCASDAAFGASFIIGGIWFGGVEYDCVNGVIQHFVQSFLMFIPQFATEWITVALSVERYVAVQYALQYHTILTKARMRILVILAWTLGALEAVVVTIYLYLVCHEDDDTYK